MGKIKYGIYPNPLPDAEGNTTYQVRHEPDSTMDKKAFLKHLKLHNAIDPIHMNSALSVLKDEIIEQLKDNVRFRIDGIGSFQIKVGLKTKKDEEGNPIRPHFTDPNQITARDVEIQGVSFTPDKSFINNLKEGMKAEKATATGVVGRSNQYTRQEVVNFLNHYLLEHRFITRRILQYEMGLSKYMAQKWLDQLCNEQYSKYQKQKEGTTIVYRRYGSKE